MTILSATRTARTLTPSALPQSARAGKLRGPEGEAPDNAIPVFFQDGDDFSVEWYTPFEYRLMKARAQLDADDRRDVDRMVHAMATGTWPVPSGEFAKMTPEQQRAVFDALPA